MKRTGDRREMQLTDFHARGLVSDAELALDAGDRFLAVRALNLSNTPERVWRAIQAARVVARPGIKIRC